MAVHRHGPPLFLGLQTFALHFVEERAPLGNAESQVPGLRVLGVPDSRASRSIGNLDAVLPGSLAVAGLAELKMGRGRHWDVPLLGLDQVLQEHPRLLDAERRRMYMVVHQLTVLNLDRFLVEQGGHNVLPVHHRWVFREV